MFYETELIGLFRNRRKTTLYDTVKSKASCSGYTVVLFFKRSFSLIRRQIEITMSDAKLDAVLNAQIDEGLFKYVLIKVYGKETADGKENFKFIVRGFERAEWHGEFP